MKYPFIFILVVLLSACSQKAENRFASDTINQSPQRDNAAKREKYMAYEHSLSIETDEGNVKDLFEKIEASCNANQASGCAILDSRLGAGQYEHATIKIRAKSDRISSLINVAASGGKIIEQSTSAEDLAGPILEGAKRIDMLQQYQKRLQALEQRPNNDVDSLIKLSKELAATQSELEQASGDNARLLERVNLDILRITIYSNASRSLLAPIKAAASSFFSNLSNGISGTITGIAYIVPWGIVIFVFWLIGRKIWRRWRS